MSGCEKGFPMLNVSTPHVVSWPTPASSAVSAVTAVDPVRRVREGAHQGQPDSEHHRQAQGSVRQPGDGAVQTRRRADEARQVAETHTEATEKRKARQAEQAAAREASAEADKARHQQLQAAFSDIWKASAAVVDRVLGQGETGELEGAGQVKAVNKAEALPSTPVEPLPWPVMPADEAVVGAAWASAQEVVAYDEHGQSSLAPLEPGILVDQQV